MIKAILFDLDDTLLINPDGVFVPRYLQLADQYFSQHWQAEALSRLLLQATRAMMTSDNVRMTNTAVAESLIAHHTGQPIEDVRSVFQQFYTQTYPALRDCIDTVANAAQVVDDARSLGVAVAIATNPLYPEEAIRQRLQWAGVSGEFALVTSSDNMHFTKPDPAYYAEIIARIGIEPDEAMMIGDSLENDIQPAQRLGLHTYYVGTTAEADGTLDDFHQLLRGSDWLDDTSMPNYNPAAINPQFRGNLGALFGLLDDVKPHYWLQRPDPNEWSIMQILCHLRESETSVHRSRLERILTEDNPFVSAPPPPGRDDPPCDEDGMRVAEDFLQQRLETMHWLESLRPEDWQRPANHSIFGMTTFLEMAQFTAQHDRLHISQICQTLGKCRP